MTREWHKARPDWQDKVASQGLTFHEPIWEMLWSNKALLALLWELFAAHPNLLDAHLGEPRSALIETKGDYGEEGYVYQAAAKLRAFDSNYPIIGSWLVTGQGARGMGIRESGTPITDNLSRFVPHYF